MTTLSPSEPTAGMPRGRPTMVDVAKHAHVSLKTVSRVVNDEPGVRPETAERVRESIRALGFRRNDGARQLRRGRTASIGLVVEDLANPFYSALAAAVERVSRRSEHLLLTASAEGSALRERSIVEAFLDRRVDGLIIVPAEAEHDWLSPEVGERTPVVFVDRPATGIEADAVLIDNRGGVRSAVEHLVAHGHRRIGFLGDDGAFWTARERRVGFEESLSELNASQSGSVAMGPYELDDLVTLLREWSAGPDGITAVITGNNRVTVQFLYAMRRSDRALALVGFDDFEYADLLDPPITVVSQDPDALGEQAAHALFSRLAGPSDDTSPRSAVREIVLPTRLIVRGSVDVTPPKETTS
ncbi:MAG TPA: LacI family DNA-binding transcriptional regulator [Nocardioidaceae bacterium]|nr:LacI family DNA-binding transcriptional regulator [Nocardioidaceae bacterium]